jgi:hypothetical protein
MLDNTDRIFGAIDQALESFANRQYFIYYSVAWHVLSKKQPGKLIPAFLTMCVPCQLNNDVAKNILDKEKLGIVEPKKGIVVLDKAVETREELIDKYKSIITCHSFCSECKLSADQLHRIDSKIRSIFDGVYLVKRVTESTGAVQIVQSGRIKIGARMGEARKKEKIRNFQMSMVFLMPYKNPQQKNTIIRMCRSVIFSIIEKVRDTKYQTGMLELMHTTARQERENNPWTAILARQCMVDLLHVYYHCYYYRIMHNSINSFRLRALTEGIFTWKKFFEQRGVIPKKSTWDLIERRREIVTEAIAARIYVREDESTDEEGEDTSQIRKSGRGVSEPPEAHL